MFWLAIPIIGLIVKVVYDVVTDEDKQPLSRQESILESNLERLKKQVDAHSGYKIAIIGQPGAGKSSLLKKMTNGKVKPLPIIGTQTDATDWSSDASCNLLSFYENYVFVDVPGYDTSSHPLDKFVSHFPFNHFDAFIFVIRGKLNSSDESIFDLTLKSGKKFLITKSFSDSLQIDEFKLIESDIKKHLSLLNSNCILFFSNRTGDGIDSIFNSININLK